jgi:hypothetical protein
MADKSSWIWHLIDLITGSKAFLISSIAIFFLFPFEIASDQQLKNLGLYDVANHYRGWIVLLLWLAASILLAGFTRWGISKIQAQFVNSATRRKMRKYWIEEMGSDQLRIIIEYFDQSRVSLPRSVHSGAIRDLEKRGFVYQAGTAISPLNTFPFALTENATRLLRPRSFHKIMGERNKLEAKRLR